MLPFATNSWVKFSGNPILSPQAGTWDGADMEQPYVIHDVENNRYAMLFEGKSSTTQTAYRVGLAFSPDGEMNWVETGTPILTNGDAGKFDHDSVGGPALLKVNSTWYLYYSGNTGGSFDGIGVATSDNIAGPYTRLNSGNPVLSLSPSGWDSFGMYLGDVWVQNGVWYLLYEGWSTVTPYWNFRIGLATSNDGLTWTKAPENPVIDVTNGSWDATVLGNPSVIVDNGLTYCFYDGQASTEWAYGKCGLATSTDNIHWVKATNYLFDPANTPGDRAECAPQVCKVGDHYNCYYCVYIGHGTYPGDYYELAFATLSNNVNSSPSTGFLGTNLPTEYGCAIVVAVGLLVVGAIILVLKRRKSAREAAR